MDEAENIEEEEGEDRERERVVGPLPLPVGAAAGAAGVPVYTYICRWWWGLWWELGSANDRNVIVVVGVSHV